MSIFALTDHGRTDGRTDGQTHIVIIVQTQRSCKIVMQTKGSCNTHIVIIAQAQGSSNFNIGMKFYFLVFIDV